MSKKDDKRGTGDLRAKATDLGASREVDLGSKAIDLGNKEVNTDSRGKEDYGSAKVAKPP